MCRGNRREEIFKDDVDRKLFLELLGETCEAKNSESFGGRMIKEHNQRQADSLIQASLPVIGLNTIDELKALRKSHPHKQAVVWLVKTRTTVRDRWLAETLNAGSRPMFYHGVKRYRAPKRRADKNLKRELENLTI